MTPFKRKQHKYVILLGIPLILFLIIIFYSRFVAFYSEPLYLEAAVSQCEFNNYNDSRSIFLTLNDIRYDFSRPDIAYSKVKKTCETKGLVGIFYHVITTPFFGFNEREIREMINLKTGEMVFSRSYYYEYERKQVISLYLMLLVFIPAIIYSFLVMLGRVDDDSIDTFKSQYKQDNGVIRVRSGEGLLDGLFMVVICFGIFLFSIYKISTDGFDWPYLVMMPFVIPGYSFLVGIVNHRKVLVKNGLLQVIKGPLPQIDSKIIIDVNDIDEIYCDYEINSSRYGQIESMSVIAALKGDSDVVLFFTRTYEEAQAITDRLNDLLKS